MDLNQAYWMAVLAMTNYVQSIESWNLSPDECTKAGDFTPEYAKDRLQADLLVDNFFQDVSNTLNGKQFS